MRRRVTSGTGCRDPWRRTPARRGSRRSSVRRSRGCSGCPSAPTVRSSTWCSCRACPMTGRGSGRIPVGRVDLRVDGRLVEVGQVVVVRAGDRAAVEQDVEEVVAVRVVLVPARRAPRRGAPLTPAAVNSRIALERLGRDGAPDLLQVVREDPGLRGADRPGAVPKLDVAALASGKRLRLRQVRRGEREGVRGGLDPPVSDGGRIAVVVLPPRSRTRAAVPGGRSRSWPPS